MSEFPQWVLDTNVIVSGLMSPHGPPVRLVDALLARILQIVVDDRIIAEYREVLFRPRIHFAPERLNAFLSALSFQVHVSAVSRSGLFASDPDDTPFLEVAACSEQGILVTGNGKHYPVTSRGSIKVLTPAEAVQALIDL